MRDDKDAGGHGILGFTDNFTQVKFEVPVCESPEPGQSAEDQWQDSAIPLPSSFVCRWAVSCTAPPCVWGFSGVVQGSVIGISKGRRLCSGILPCSTASLSKRERPTADPGGF